MSFSVNAAPATNPSIANAQAREAALLSWWLASQARDSTDLHISPDTLVLADEFLLETIGVGLTATPQGHCREALVNALESLVNSELRYEHVVEDVTLETFEMLERLREFGTETMTLGEVKKRQSRK